MTRASCSRRDDSEPRLELIDSAGRRIMIEKEVFRGGEGTVHPVVGHSELFAKLYHSGIDDLQQAKLVAMTRSTSEPLLRVAAWPTATLHASAGGRMVGFLMPRFDGQRAELHQLYTPSTRKQSFRQADWAFLVQAARNVAAAVATVHAAGHVVGDVNQRNFIVGGDATVKVLDCDSFQVRGASRLFYCKVGMPEFTPPELQNRVLDGIERTQNHDAFGLAVLCFQLLFMGRHPYAGRFLGSGEMPIERAISEGRFAFGREHRTRLMEPPPNMVSFESLPPRLAALFESSLGGSSIRPTAKEWCATLDDAQLELRACSVEPMHKYYKALPQCSWCRLETVAGVYFFIGLISTQTAAFDLGRLWADVITMTSLPYEPPARPTFQLAGAAVPLALPARRRMAIGAKAAIALLLGVITVVNPLWVALTIIACVVVIALPLPGSEERKRRLARFHAAERAWLDAYKSAEREITVEPLLRKRAGLQAIRKSYEALNIEKQAELEKMKSQARDLQLYRYLDQHQIRKHSIPDIGVKRKATLAAWGIDTAADITFQSIATVQGFGPTLRARLFAWRALLESKFVFDSKHAIPQQDLDAFEYRWNRRKLELQQHLRSGAEEVRRINQAICRRRQTIADELLPVARNWSQARADLEVINHAVSFRRAAS